MCNRSQKYSGLESAGLRKQKKKVIILYVTFTMRANVHMNIFCTISAMFQQVMGVIYFYFMAVEVTDFGVTTGCFGSFSQDDFKFLAAGSSLILRLNGSQNPM